MNLFFLSYSIEEIAKFHCDKHVVKMLLELVQMLYTAHHCCESVLPANSYRIASKNHPMCIWIRTSESNYRFGTQLAIELSKEYTYRYNKVHSCDSHLDWLSHNVPYIGDKQWLIKPDTIFANDSKITNLGLTPVPLCMPPDVMNTTSVVRSYRNYYITYKKSFTLWKNRPIPHWFVVIDFNKVKFLFGLT